MHAKCTIPRQKNPKLFWEGGCPRHHPHLGGGHPLSKPHPLGACGASILIVPSALDLPPNENP